MSRSPVNTAQFPGLAEESFVPGQRFNAADKNVRTLRNGTTCLQQAGERRRRSADQAHFVCCRSRKGIGAAIGAI
jgi:hypothetical protein